MALEPITVNVQRLELDAQGEAAAVDAGASAQEIAMIRTLRERAAEFERARQELQAAGPAIAKTNDYDLMVEYGELVNRADSIHAKIQSVTAAIDDAMKWARATFGGGGMRTLSDLGIAWFIPMAAIAAALGVIGYFLNDYAQFVRRYKEQQRIAGDLVSQGIDPAVAQRQAAAAVAETSPTIWSGFFSGASPWLAIAGLLVVGYVAYRRAR